MATIEDFARVLRRADEDSMCREILRVVMHPVDFRILALDSRFQTIGVLDGFGGGVSGVECRGVFGSAKIHVDPRNEQGVVYVVTTDGARVKGCQYRLDEPPRPGRRTSWARILDDVPVGVDPSSEHQDISGDPRGLRLRT